MSFGKKYVVFWGITSPRRARSKTSSIRVARSRKAPSNRTVVDLRDGIGRVGRVPDPVVADEPLDELDVELAGLTDNREGPPPR